MVNLIFDHLQQATVEISNLDMRELAHPGIIIWPVVPRDLATAIHRGQAEVIRFLVLLGWTVKLLMLIVDHQVTRECIPKLFLIH
jgi:hypothetical protein